MGLPASPDQNGTGSMPAAHLRNDKSVTIGETKFWQSGIVEGNGGRRQGVKTYDKELSE